MRRRDFLKVGSAAVVGVSAWPRAWAGSVAGKKQKVLYFTRSAGFEHSVVRRRGGKLGHSERILTEMGQRAGFEVVCTKDGRVFDQGLDDYDAIAFYTSGDLTRPNRQGTPPMTPAGKQRLLEAIAGGKGFVAFHAASDSFHSKGPRNRNQQHPDPYIAMLGGEFLTHGAQQRARLTVASQFPGVDKLDTSEGLSFYEEWYALKNFAKDLHVILIQETEGMKGGCYQRPNYPSTWARRHGKGRVFYTSLGHREDIWTNPYFQTIVLGGFAWVLGNVEADVTPNIDKVTPHASQLGG